jgi:hypothetical protein
VEVARKEQGLLARAEKALVDLLYLTPESDNPHHLKELHLKELRLSFPEEFSWEDLQATAETSGSKKVARAVSLLRKHFRQEQSWRPF